MSILLLPDGVRRGDSVYIYGTGDNTYSEINANPPVNETTFTRISTFDSFGTIKQASGGYKITVAVNSAGIVSLIGFDGAGNISPAWQIPGQTVPFKSVHGAINYLVAIDINGIPWGWGNNNYSQLTNGGIGAFVTSMTQLAGWPPGVKALKVATGNQFTCILGDDNNIYVCGQGAYYSIGNTLANITTLTPIPTMPGIPIDVRCCYGSTIILLNDGTVWGRGANNFNNLSADFPPSINYWGRSIFPSTELGVKLGGGEYHNVVIANNGKPYAVGHNDHGQCGKSTVTNPQNYLTAMNGWPAGVNATDVSYGLSYHSLVLGDNNLVYGCGSNVKGEITGTSTANVTSLRSCTGLNSTKKVLSISTGLYFSVVVTKK